MTIFDSIKQKLSIVEVINTYISLKRAGIYWKGQCPFHKENTPSFTVSPHRQIFYCFGCKASGDIISFVAQIEQYSQFEAAQQLIRRYQLPIDVDQTGDQEYKNYHQKQKNIKLNELVSKWCCYWLERSPEAQAYLTSRAIDAKTISQFYLGYFPSGKAAINNLVSLLIKHEFSIDDAIKRGIFYRFGGELRSAFEERIIFPIKDYLGHICGFGGRIFKKLDKRVKYYNSREQDLFSKGSLLFGLDCAKKSISELGYVYIVEGYLDTLALVQAGYTNTVATLGTACTQEHLNLLTRYAQKIYVTYDADSAGVRAISAIAEKCWNSTLEPYVITLPNKEDPASLLAKGIGFDQFKDKAQDIFSFSIKELTKNTPSASLSEKLKLTNHLLLLIKQMRDALKQDILLHKAAEALSISVSHLRETMNKMPIKSKKDLTQEFKINNIKTDSNVKREELNYTEKPRKLNIQVVNNTGSILEKKLFSAILLEDPALTLEDKHLIAQWLTEPLKSLIQKVLEIQKIGLTISIDSTNDMEYKGFSPEDQNLIRAIILESEPEEINKTELNTAELNAALELNKSGLNKTEELVKEFYKKRWKLVIHHVKLKIKQAQQAQDIDLVQNLLCQLEKYKKKMTEKGIV